MRRNRSLHVQGVHVVLYELHQESYISLTDIAKYRNTHEPFSVINNWMRSRSTIKFLGLWERLNNTDFKPVEF